MYDLLTLAALKSLIMTSRGQWPNWRCKRRTATLTRWGNLRVGRLLGGNPGTSSLFGNQLLTLITLVHVFSNFHGVKKNIVLAPLGVILQEMQRVSCFQCESLLQDATLVQQNRM